MKTKLSSVITSALLATTVIGFSAVDAQAKPTSCTASTVALKGISYTNCEGQFSGNDTGSGSLINDLNDGKIFSKENLFDVNEDLWSLAGKSDGESGMFNFKADNNFTSGNWSLNGNLDKLFGADLTATFAVSFKAATNYSVYLFKDFQITAADLAAGKVVGNFTTNGVSLNGGGKAQALSHASLWVYNGKEETYQPPNEVPEPSAVAALGLLATGMLGMRKKAGK